MEGTPRRLPSTGIPPGYSGYRSKEGYSGFRPHSDLSNIRSSNDQLRSSECLQSMTRPPPSERSEYERAQLPPHLAPSSPARSPPSPHKPLNMSPEKVHGYFEGSGQGYFTERRPKDYEIMPTIEGYAGHRPKTPAANSLGSGGDSWIHSLPRDNGVCSPHRVRYLSHGRGVYVP